MEISGYSTRMIRGGMSGESGFARPVSNRITAFMWQDIAAFRVVLYIK